MIKILSKRLNSTLAGYTEALRISLAGGSEKDRHRHTEINKKLFVHDRLKLLLDDYENDFINLSPLAGYQMTRYGTVPSGGRVAGIGSVSGKKCLIMADDATVKAGALYPVSVQKTLRLQEIAKINRLPIIYIVDGAGAFLPLQSEIFNPGGGCFRNIAQLKSMGVSQISIVAGSCTAGAAYIPTMCDQTVMVDGISSIYLGGPPLVQAATGEMVSAEQLGGATVHCMESGYCDFFAENEMIGFEQIRNIAETISCESGSTEIYFEEDKKNVLFPDKTGLIENQDLPPPNSEEIISNLFDNNTILNKFKPTYSTDVTCCFGYINKNLVGLVANNSDTISDKGLNLAAHFINLCSDRKSVKSLIFIQNGDISPEHKPTNPKLDQNLNGFSRFLTSVAVCDTPRITLITGHQENDFNVFSSQSSSPNFVFRWPEAGFRDMPSWRCSAELLDDGVILRENTRHVLAKIIPCVKRRNQNMDEPIFRM